MSAVVKVVLCNAYVLLEQTQADRLLGAAKRNDAFSVLRTDKLREGIYGSIMMGSGSFDTISYEHLQRLVVAVESGVPLAESVPTAEELADYVAWKYEAEFAHNMTLARADAGIARGWLGLKQGSRVVAQVVAQLRGANLHVIGALLEPTPRGALLESLRKKIQTDVEKLR